MVNVERLQHASVPRPPGVEAHDQAVRFYSGVLGLELIPKPTTFTAIDVSWFKVGDAEIHLYAAQHDEPGPIGGAHFCLVVADLDGMRSRLERAGISCHETAPIPNRPRFMTSDPFGNWIELTAIEGPYIAEHN